MPFAVGVFGGIKSATGVGHVPEHVADDIARDLGKASFPANQVSIEIQVHQLCVVIQHLFKVRHQPVGIHGIARKPAPDLIVDASCGHSLTGMQNHLHRVVILESNAVAKQVRGMAR